MQTLLRTARWLIPCAPVWRENPARHSDAPIAFLISVPKRRLRHAVDRVTMRRRIREAYRLHHQDFNLPQGSRIDLAFVYVGNGLTSYAAVEKAMLRLLADVEKQPLNECTKQTGSEDYVAAHTILQSLHLAYVSACMPVHPHMQPVRAGGTAPPRPA